MKERQSKWKGVFRHPYRAHKNKTKEIVALLEKKKPDVKEKQQHIFEKVIIHYKNSTSSIHFHDAARIHRFFSDTEKNNLFVDMRKKLKVEEIMPILEKILSRMQTPYYNLLIRGELLSAPTTSYNHKPASFGLVRIPIFKRNFCRQQKLFLCLKDPENAQKLENVVTGKIMHEEAQLNKNTSGQRKELEELLVHFDDLKGKKRYPSFDRKIKSTAFYYIFFAFYLFSLVFLSYQGIFWGAEIAIVRDLSPVIINSALVSMGVWFLFIATNLYYRKGRWLTIVGSTLFCGLLSYLIYMGQLETEKIYFLYAPWLLLHSFIVLRFLNPQISPYFLRQFGIVYARLSILHIVFMVSFLGICIFSNIVFYYNFLEAF